MDLKKFLIIPLIFLLLLGVVNASEYEVTSYTAADLAKNVKDLHPSDSVEWSAIGESFQCPTYPSGYNLTKVSFQFRIFGSPIGNVTAVLYSMTGTLGTNGKPTGSALATSENFDVSSANTSYIWYNFTFSSAYNLVSGQNYCITLQNPTSGTIDDSNFVIPRLSIFDEYVGNAFYYRLGVWNTTETATWDVNFIIYGEGVEKESFEYIHPYDVGVYWFTNTPKVTISGVTDWQWNVIDISSHIPDGFNATGVIFDIHSNNNTSTFSTGVRAPGSTDDFRIDVDADHGAGQYAQEGLAITAINSTGHFELWCHPWADDFLDLYIRGFTDDTVYYFSNAQNKTTATYGQFVKVDCSDIVPIGTDSVFVVIENNNSTAPVLAEGTVRPGGSSISDNTTTCAIDYQYSRYAFVGLNSSRCFDQYVSERSMECYVLAYNDPSTFYSYGERIEITMDVGDGNTWTKEHLANNGTGIFAMYFDNRNATGGPTLELRHGDSTDDRASALAGDDRATVYEADYARAQIWDGCGLNFTEDMQFFFNNAKVELWLYGGTNRTYNNYTVTLSQYPTNIVTVEVDNVTWADYSFTNFSNQVQVNNLFYVSCTIDVYYEIEDFWGEELTITDMEGCGDWVFQGEAYYTFQAEIACINGSSTFDTIEIAFTDGVHWINASYDHQDSGWLLESGEEYVNLQDGTTSVFGAKLTVTFLIYFESKILDALDVNLHMYVNSTSGATTGWQTIQTDYFNIYNHGSIVEDTFSSNAGRLTGGSAMQIYVQGENSSAMINLTLRKLQHWHGMLALGHNTTKDMSGAGWLGNETKRDIVFYSFGISYCYDDVWYDGWWCNITYHDSGFDDHNWIGWVVEWYWQGTKIKEDYLTSNWDADNPGVNVNSVSNNTAVFYIDLWFTKENASSWVGGRINSEYFGIYKTGAWFWSNYHPMMGNVTQSMFFHNLEDGSGNLIQVHQLELMQLWIKVEKTLDSNDTDVWLIGDIDLNEFSLTKGEMTGVNTPIFTSTKNLDMPITGFLAPLYAIIGGFISALGEAFGPALLGFWAVLVAFLDTIAGALGFQGGFTTFLTWVTSFFGWIGLMFTSTYEWVIYILIPIFQGLTDNVTSVMNILGSMIVSVLQVIPSMLAWLDVAIVDSGLSELFYSALILLGIMLPFLEIVRMEQKGFFILFEDLNRIMDIVAFILNIALRIINTFLAIIGRIIESVPIIE